MRVVNVSGLHRHIRHHREDIALEPGAIHAEVLDVGSAFGNEAGEFGNSTRAVRDENVAETKASVRDKTWN